MHKGRLGTIVIDCQTDDLAAATFWGQALAPTGQRFCVGRPRRPDFAEHANDWP